jgi:hypothetical protein
VKITHTLSLVFAIATVNAATFDSNKRFGLSNVAVAPQPVAVHLAQLRRSIRDMSNTTCDCTFFPYNTFETIMTLIVVMNTTKSTRILQGITILE